MRKVAAVAAIASLATVGTVGIAQAIDVDQGLTVKVSGKVGTKKKPRAVKLAVTTTTSAKDQAKNGTFATNQAVISFDKHLKFNNKKFPTCTETQANADESKCPKGSKVGTGKVEALAGPTHIPATADVNAYNGKGNTLVLKLNTTSGPDATGTIVTKLKNASGKYGKKLVVPIPAKYQSQLGLKITLTKFATTVKAKYKGVNYVESIGCSGGKYRFAGSFAYDDGSKADASSTAKC